MAESEMVLKVARAICCPEGCTGTGNGIPCDIEAEDRTSIWQAKAALKAMLEPTPEMCAAAYQPNVDGPGSMFRAMISAALGQEGTEG